MILDLQNVDAEGKERRRTTRTESKKLPPKELYTKPKATEVRLDDDEALLKLFKQNRENVQELRRAVNALQKKNASPTKD